MSHSMAKMKDVGQKLTKLKEGCLHLVDCTPGASGWSQEALPQGSLTPERHPRQLDLTNMCGPQQLRDTILFREWGAFIRIGQG